jgi:NADH-quinone oxidoreductase subunit L
MMIPLVVLAVLSVVGGFIELPGTLGNLPLFSNLLHSVLPAPALASTGNGTELVLQVVAGVLALTGVWIAYYYFVKKPDLLPSYKNIAVGSKLNTFLKSGWKFDSLYDWLFVKPVVYLARIDAHDIMDSFYMGIAALVNSFHRILSRTQSGRLQWYLMGIILGAIISFTLMILL